MPTPPAQPFSRLHVKDPDIERVIQDLYDKLAQIQAEVAQVKATIPPTP